MKRFIVLIALAASGFFACNSDNGMSPQTPQPQAQTSSATTSTATATPQGGNMMDVLNIPQDESAEQKFCHPNNFKGQSFRVVAVSGHVITASEKIKNCRMLKGEVRRKATGIREFVGDLDGISDRQVRFDPVDLPDKCLPKVGETLKVIWKQRRHH